MSAPDGTGSAELDALIALVDAFEDEIRDEFKNGTGGYTYKARRELLLAVRECVRDAKRLDWVEAQHTLHKAVEFLYVVDGYETTLTHDGNPDSPHFHGSNLRESIDAAIASQTADGGEQNG